MNMYLAWRNIVKVKLSLDEVKGSSIVNTSMDSSSAVRTLMFTYERTS